MPVVVAEIAFGILIGPQALGLAEADGVVDFMSDVGLVFLFFLAGLEVDFDRIRGRPAKLGGVGWVLSAALALAIAGLLEARGLAISALIIGVALCTTAIGTLMPILRDAGELRTGLGPYILAAGVAGEFGPLLLMTLLLTSDAAPGVTFALLVVFIVVSVGAAFVALRARPPHVVETIRRTMSTSGQLALRLSLALLFGLVYLASRFGFDIVLGAFAAGLVVGLVVKGSDEAEAGADQVRRHRLRLPDPDLLRRHRNELRPRRALREREHGAPPADLPARSSSSSRDAPALLLYRKAIPSSDRLPLAFYSATALPIVVTVTTIGVETDRMKPATAAALVGAAMVSVLVFPLVALGLRRRSARESAGVPVGEPG